MRRYVIKDNFLRFWFRYIYPNKSKIEQGVLSFADFKEEYNQYLGSIFEEIAMQILKRTHSPLYFGSYGIRKGKNE